MEHLNQSADRKVAHEEVVGGSDSSIVRERDADKSIHNETQNDSYVRWNFKFSA